jgi:hypothetical protein
LRLKRGYKASEIFEGSQEWEDDEPTFEQKYKKICFEIKELMAESEKVLFCLEKYFFGGRAD